MSPKQDPAADEENGDSFQQHARNLRGEEEDDIILDDVGEAVKPLGSNSSSERSGKRSFNSLSDHNRDISQQGSSFNSRQSSSRSGSSYSGFYHQKRIPPSALRSSQRFSNSGNMRGDDIAGSAHSRVSWSGTVNTKAFATNQQTRYGTKVRAIIALICLGLSIIMAVFLGYGSTGRWLTSIFIRAPGSTAAKEAPMVGGMPGAIGTVPVYNATYETPDLEKLNIALPAAVETGYADWHIPFPAAERTDLPLFWYIPRSGGPLMQQILGRCLGLVEISKDGAGHQDETSLRILETAHGTRYMNIDPTTPAGLQRAKTLNVVQSGLADVMFTNLITDAADIFTPQNKGRLFAVFRHPLERAMGTYNALRSSDPSVEDMSIADFANTRLPNNELVRALAGKGPSENLSDDDLFLAMEIVRRKCVVGLVDRLEESLVRFNGYFGWETLQVDSVAKCQSEMLAPALETSTAMPQGDAFNAMVRQNRLDLRLHDYALYMYDVQGGNSRQA